VLQHFLNVFGRFVFHFTNSSTGTPTALATRHPARMGRTIAAGISCSVSTPGGRAGWRRSLSPGRRIQDGAIRIFFSFPSPCPLGQVLHGGVCSQPRWHRQISGLGAAFAYDDSRTEEATSHSLILALVSISASNVRRIDSGSAGQAATIRTRFGTISAGLVQARIRRHAGLPEPVDEDELCGERQRIGNQMSSVPFVRFSVEMRTIPFC
jgi:hypothetical protein